MEFFVFAPLTNNLCNNSHALTWYELEKKQVYQKSSDT